MRRPRRAEAMPVEGTEHRTLAAIMFTDMVGYSVLAQQNEARALDLLEEHRRLLRPIFAQHHGHEIKTIGDAFMVEFASPVEAVRCAIAMQQRLHEHNHGAAPERRLRIRIGVHLGDVVHREGDVYGDGVNIAARIEPLAAAGGICVTQQVFDHVHNKLDAPLIKLVAGELKNIQSPVNVYSVALPWTSQRFSILQRTAFRLRQKRTRAVLVAAVVLLSAGWASWKFFQQPVEKSHAVLPFVDLSPGSTNESLSEGFSEQLITALSQVEGLRVVPRASAFAFKGKKETTRRIGEQLQVATVLVGTVRVVGNKLQITTELVKVATGYNLWATNYDREMADIFAIQSEVAQRVVESLKVRLLAGEQQKLAKKPTEDPEAFRRYAGGRFFWNTRTAASLQMAIQHFKQALEIDPHYALAYAGLADAYSSLGLSAFVADAQKPTEVMPLAEAAAKRALEIDPSLAEAHVALFFIRFYYDWNWQEAEKEIEEALRLDARSAHAYHWHSHWLVAMGRWNESLVQSQKALKADPLDWMMNIHLAWHYRCVGDPDRAVEESKKALLMNPNSYTNYRYLGLAYEQNGQYGEAITALKKASDLQPDSAEAAAELGHVYAVSGQPDEARKILNQLMERRNKGFISAYDLALIHAGLGEKAEALHWLEQAYDEKSDRLVDLKVDRAFRHLQSEERFAKLLEKLRLGN